MDMTSTSQSIYIPDELLEALKAAFPDALPRREVLSWDLGKLAGQQSVIDWLIMQKEQEDT